MSLIDVRKAIAAAMFDATGKLATSGTHGGRFGPDELTRWAKRAPCVLSACLGIRSMWLEGSQPVADVQWASYVITKGGLFDERDAHALALAGQVLAAVPGNRWNGTATRAPQNIRADNLYSAALDKLGVAIWAVSWTQDVDLTINGLKTLDNWESMVTTFDIEDATPTTPTTIDQTDLPQ